MAESVETKTVSIAAPENSSGFSRLLLLTGSGCAALIYEVVWFQWLELVIRSSAISLALLPAAYMGGLCLGSAALRRLVPARKQPLLVYASLES
jgi:spermidine synthase